MNSILAEIYSTIIPSAPYIIAAYVLVWVILMILVFLIHNKLKRAEERLAILEEELSEANGVMTDEEKEENHHRWRDCHHCHHCCRCCCWWQ